MGGSFSDSGVVCWLMRILRLLVWEGFGVGLLVALGVYYYLQIDYENWWG